MTEGNTLKKAMIEALEKSLGIVTTAAEQVGISRKTHYQWLKEDQDYKEAVEELTNAALDYAESKLFEKITGVEVQAGFDKSGEPIIYTQPPSDTAIIFYLKTKGKKRGYIEKTEVEQSGGLFVNWHEEKTYNKPEKPEFPKDREG